MIMQLGSALDDQIDGSATSAYVEIPAKIGFFQKLKLEREGKELPKERITLPLKVTVSIWAAVQCLIGLIIGLFLLFTFYILFLSPDRVFLLKSGVSADIYGQIAGTFFGIFALFGGAVILYGTAIRASNFFRPGPLFVIETEGFRYASLSSELVPWSDIAFYEWMSGRGGTYGIRFFLRKAIPGDKRWRHERIEQYARRKNLGASIIVIPVSALSCSNRVLTDVLKQLAVSHGAKPRPTWYNPDSLTID